MCRRSNSRAVSSFLAQDTPSDAKSVGEECTFTVPLRMNRREVWLTPSVCSPRKMTIQLLSFFKNKNRSLCFQRRMVCPHRQCYQSFQPYRLTQSMRSVYEIWHIPHFPLPAGMFNGMPQSKGLVEYPQVPIVLLKGNVAFAKANQSFTSGINPAGEPVGPF